jgi:hypothetical protein
VHALGVIALPLIFVPSTWIFLSYFLLLLIFNFILILFIDFLGACYGKYKESHMRIQNDSRSVFNEFQLSLLML